MTKSRDGMLTTRRAYIGEAGFEYLISLLVSGDLLVFLLSYFHFNDSITTIITHVVTFSCTAAIFSLFFAGRRVKKFVTVCHIINQGCFVLLYLVPFVPFPDGAKPAVFLALFIIGHFLNNAINSPKITWLMRAVPDDRRGSFTAVKEMISLAAGMALSMGVGAFADYMKAENNMEAYYLICAGGLIALTLLHTLTLLISKEPPLPEDVKPLSPRAAFRQIFEIPSIGKVMAVGVLWNIAIGFSVSSFAVYKQNDLGFTMFEITMMATVASLCRLVFSPLMGKLADKISFSRNMTICLAIAGMGFLVNAFTVPEFKWIHMAYICLYYIAMAGINSGSINLIFDFVPLSGRQAAMGLKNAIGGVLGFVSGLLGGLILGAIQGADGTGKFHLFGLELYAQQFLSFISFVMIALLILYMFFVIFPLQKKREAERKAAFSLEEESADV